jgi:glycolate oxidase iron-sulfur subunit
MASAPQSAFDQHHPPSPELINKCVHCGFCLQTCPTYALWGEEMDSPRGRIYLMNLLTQGKIELNSAVVGHFDACLGCMACMPACPSGVDYGKLIEATRAQIERNFPRSGRARRIRNRVLKTFPSVARLRSLRAPLWLYQRTGLRWLAQKSGALKLLPAHLQMMERVLPPLTPEIRLPERIPAQGKQRLRVGLLLGCVQQVFFSGVNAATARVLAAEGCEVIIPPSQGCCGALMVHAGAENEALALARETIDRFEAAQVDAIAVNAAGCGSNMKEYGHLLRDDPQYAARAAALATKVRDVAELFAELGPQAPRKPLSLRVAYHDACHLQHAQGVRTQPRALLQSIPGVELLEIAESALCCGSAGIYNLVEPDAARDLAERKVRNIISTGADVVAAGNPGCLLQIRAELQRAGSKIRTMHTIELLDAAIRGAAPVS